MTAYVMSHHVTFAFDSSSRYNTCLLSTIYCGLKVHGKVDKPTDITDIILKCIDTDFYKNFGEQLEILYEEPAEEDKEWYDKLMGRQLYHAIMKISEAFGVRFSFFNAKYMTRLSNNIGLLHMVDAKYTTHTNDSLIHIGVCLYHNHHWLMLHTFDIVSNIGRDEYVFMMNNLDIDTKDMDKCMDEWEKYIDDTFKPYIESFKRPAINDTKTDTNIDNDDNEWITPRSRRHRMRRPYDDDYADLYGVTHFRDLSYSYIA